MTDSSVEEKTCAKVELWRDRVTEHRRSGLSVKKFCKERGISAWSFYCLAQTTAGSWAGTLCLNRTKAAREESTVHGQVEVVLVSGESSRVASDRSPRARLGARPCIYNHLLLADLTEREIGA